MAHKMKAGDGFVEISVKNVNQYIVPTHFHFPQTEVFNYGE